MCKNTKWILRIRSFSQAFQYLENLIKRLDSATTCTEHVALPQLLVRICFIVPDAYFIYLLFVRLVLRPWHYVSLKVVENAWKNFSSVLTLKSKSDIISMLHNQKRHGRNASCEFYRLDSSLSWSCVKHFAVIKLHQVCENQACCNLIFADFLQVVVTTCIKLVDKKSWQSTCIKPVDNKPMTASFLYVFFLFLFAGFFRIFQRTTSLCFRKIAITGQLLAN